MKIGGKYYQLVKSDSGSDGKKRLQKLANKWRAKGYSARIISRGWGPWKPMKFKAKYWELFVRK